ncbi:MAG TPA: hypothetical protein PKC03_02790 [Dokdonella sp.]|nr:hypothetical protein [Dokdonella sp.]
MDTRCVNPAGLVRDAVSHDGEVAGHGSCKPALCRIFGFCGIFATRVAAIVVVIRAALDPFARVSNAIRE